MHSSSYHFLQRAERLSYISTPGSLPNMPRGSNHRTQRVNPDMHVSVGTPAYVTTGAYRTLRDVRTTNTYKFEQEKVRTHVSTVRHVANYSSHGSSTFLSSLSSPPEEEVRSHRATDGGILIYISLDLGGPSKISPTSTNGLSPTSDTLDQEYEYRAIELVLHYCRVHRSLCSSDIALLQGQK